MLPMLKSRLWSPVRRSSTPFDALWGDMDRWVSRFLHDEDWPDHSFQPSLDVTEDEEALRVRAEIPGIDPQDVHLEIHGGVLTLRGEKKDEQGEDEDGRHWSERRYGSFARAISLPEYVDHEKVEADYKDGVLTITLPKSEKAKPREISVKVG